MDDSQNPLPFGYTLHAPPEPPAGTPLLSDHDTRAINAFFEDFISGQTEGTTEGLHFSDDWMSLPPQFMGTSTSLEDETQNNNNSNHTNANASQSATAEPFPSHFSQQQQLQQQQSASFSSRHVSDLYSHSPTPPTPDVVAAATLLQNSSRANSHSATVPPHVNHCIPHDEAPGSLSRQLPNTFAEPYPKPPHSHPQSQTYLFPQSPSQPQPHAPSQPYLRTQSQSLSQISPNPSYPPHAPYHPILPLPSSQSTTPQYQRQQDLVSPHHSASFAHQNHQPPANSLHINQHVPKTALHPGYDILGNGNANGSSISPAIEWGTDSNFSPGSNYIPPANHESYDSLVKQQLSMIQCLEATHSNTSTRPASPQPHPHPQSQSQSPSLQPTADSVPPLSLSFASPSSSSYPHSAHATASTHPTSAVSPRSMSVDFHAASILVNAQSQAQNHPSPTSPFHPQTQPQQQHAPSASLQPPRKRRKSVSLATMQTTSTVIDTGHVEKPILGHGNEIGAVGKGTTTRRNTTAGNSMNQRRKSSKSVDIKVNPAAALGFLSSPTNGNLVSNNYGVMSPPPPPSSLQSPTIKQPLSHSPPPLTPGSDTVPAKNGTTKRKKSIVTLTSSIDSKTSPATATNTANGLPPPPSAPNSTAAAAKPARENLTEQQKRENHIRSEQKRRAIIKEGFEDLCRLVPRLQSGGNGTGSSGGGSGNFSKSVMLGLAADWLEDVLRGNEKLEQQLATLRRANNS